MPIKSVKMKISKNNKMRFFHMSQGSLDPKNRFLGQEVCHVARVHDTGHLAKQRVLSWSTQIWIHRKSTLMYGIWHARHTWAVFVTGGVFYLNSPEGPARAFHQLTLPCGISLPDGPKFVTGPILVDLIIHETLNGVYSVFIFVSV